MYELVKLRYNGQKKKRKKEKKENYLEKSTHKQLIVSIYSD